MRLLPEASGQFERLVYAPDGSRLAASARPGPSVWLWDLRGGSVQRLKEPRTPAPLAPLPPDNLLAPLAYSPSGDLLAIGGERQLSRRDSRTNNELYFPDASSHQSLRLAFTPDGQTLVSAGHDLSRGAPRTAVFLWDVASARGRKLRAPFPTGTEPLAATWDASLLLWREPPPPRGPSHVTLWHVPGRRPLARLGLAAVPACGTFSPDGRQIALGVEDVVLLYEIGHVLDYFGTAVGSAPWGALTLSLRWKSFASHLPPLGAAKVLEGHHGDVEALAYLADGETLLSGGRDGTVRCWDLSSLRQREAWSWAVGAVTALAVAPDGMTAAAGGSDGRALIWDLTWF
jgi:WD40 repeat protein